MKSGIGKEYHLAYTLELNLDILHSMILPVWIRSKITGYSSISEWSCLLKQRWFPCYDDVRKVKFKALHPQLCLSWWNIAIPTFAHDYLTDDNSASNRWYLLYLWIAAAFLTRHYLCQFKKTKHERIVDGCKHRFQ